MSEERGPPRFMPRPGAKISITFGESIAPRLEPVVAAHRRDVPVYPTGSDEAHEADRETRIRITQELQDAVQRLGEAVETREGRFATGQWSQSRERVVI